MSNPSILDFKRNSIIKLEDLKNVYIIALRDADQEIQNQAPQHPCTLDLVLIGEDDEKEYLLSYVNCWSDDVADVDDINPKLREIITGYNDLVKSLKSKISDLESDLNNYKSLKESLIEKENRISDLEDNIFEVWYTDKEEKFEEEIKEDNNSFSVANPLSMNELYAQLKKPSKIFKF